MGLAKKESGDQGGCSLLEVGREVSRRSNCQGQVQQGHSNQPVRRHPLGLILYTTLGKGLIIDTVPKGAWRGLCWERCCFCSTHSAYTQSDQQTFTPFLTPAVQRGVSFLLPAHKPVRSTLPPTFSTLLHLISFSPKF